MILPKDYIRMRLTGEVFSDYSDASATLLFDVRKKEWSLDIIDSLNLERNIFPKCRESFDIVGHITKKAELETGFAAGTPVMVGCSDQSAQLLGNGVSDHSQLLIILGTGGQVLAPVTDPIYDASFRTNTFCNVRNWYVMGAILNAGLAIK